MAGLAISLLSRSRVLPGGVGERRCFDGEALVANRFESLLYVVLMDDEGERPCPRALFLTELEPQASECFGPLLSTLSCAPKSESRSAVKGVLSGGLSLLAGAFFADFDTSAPIAVRSSCRPVAVSFRLGLLLRVRD